jgi:hypothetical protein
VSLDGTWDFYLDPEQRFDPDNFDRNNGVRRINVPGPWQAQFQDLRDYTGVAWYRLKFDLPPSFVRPGDPDTTCVIHFGAVDYFAAVWLNGRFIGTHEGGYLPFELSLDAALELEATNELVVRVLDPGAEGDSYGETEVSFSEIPHGKQSWYGPISGIWQSVYIEIRHATYIEQLHVTPDVPGEKAEIEIRFNRATGAPLSLKLMLTDPHQAARSTCVAVVEGTERFETTLDMPSPLLWDAVTPHLYTLEATLYETPAFPLDSVSTHFGMRSIAASADGHLMLNGRTLYLRGALDQDYYPALMYTPFSDAELDRQFAQAKHMGLNCLRTHIKITDPRYYDAADRAGILIWTELPNWENLTPAVRQRARDTLEGMIARDWNHPSIIIWTLVNESWGVELAANPEHRRWLAETYDHVKALDPHRLVVGNSACFANFHVVTDIQDFHNYYSMPDHYRQWRDWVENFALRPAWAYAHEYVSIHDWREFLRDPWNARERSLAPEVRRTGSEPLVISEFGNWGLPDVAELRACYNGQEPWWFETGLEWGDGAVYPHGAEHRFRQWHLNRVFPTWADLARASQRLQFQALKYQIEQIRLHLSIVGYVITEFTDVHWECNGLLDMCRNPKAYYDELAMINAADVIVPDWERTAYWAGERVELPLFLSHFSQADLQGSRLEWRLKDGAEVSGTLELPELAPAGITPIGAIRFEAPGVEASERARVELQLVDRAGRVAAQNYQMLYFFPRRSHAQTYDARRAGTGATGEFDAGAGAVRLAAPPHLADALTAMGYEVETELVGVELAVTNELTDDMRRYIQRGGKVLWLAETDDCQQTDLGVIQVVPRAGRRWQGDWASNMNWIRGGPMFKDIPTDGLVDFAFADLTPEHVIQGFAPRDFAANVHAGLFVGWVHHPVALVGERRFGNGTLLISTFRLAGQVGANPVATIMVRDMIDYLARGGRGKRAGEIGAGAVPAQ